jgi:hypothetical protein
VSFIASKIVAPIYRLFYGPPLAGLEAARSGGGVDHEPHRHLAIIADGVGGLDVCGTGLRYVMGAAGFRHAIEVYSWGHGLGRWLADLTDVKNRDAQARSIADLVRGFKAARPEGSVFLLGKSGGSGVIVKALERLDENVVERAILLAPALSPTYDLSQALRAVRRELVVFWSPLDILILGLGTLVFGTADRAFTRSAGQRGFVVPALGDGVESGPRAYAKLRQIRWQPAMMKCGYLGGHFGPDSPLFLKKYVLPLLRPEIQNEY